uniref:Cysteine and histidine-rich domain-containing protein 1-like isoform X1 n=1 Tax=Hirondellea gigas TaxID=1518452 RepID=A0A6A7G2P2_9CRUS
MGRGGATSRKVGDQNASCEYHPGEPVFHDADKLWSCCKKRSKDFTEFLSMPGCSRGSHNSDRPVPAAALNSSSAAADTPAQRPPLPRLKERPSFDAKMLKLNPSISPSLAQLLKQQNEESTDEEQLEIDPDTGITIGENCKRNGCKTSYISAGSNLELCTYHSGGPVFHEGLKYWSCCQRKTTDFTDFLAQPGCCTDTHLWLDDDRSSEKTVCRYDWHQTGSHVYVTVYAKGTMPGLSTVSAGPVRLCAGIRHAKNLQFDLDVELAGLVDPAQCSVEFAATKVEVKLKKDEYVHWARLQLEKRKEKANNATTTETNGTDDARQAAEELSEDVEAVDLSDL